MLLCFCFLRYILCWFLMIAYDCINLTHSPCGIWTMVENWHTTVMVTIQILWSALSIVVFFVSLFILLVSILNGMSTNRLQLFFWWFLSSSSSFYLVLDTLWNVVVDVRIKNTNLPEIGGGEDVIWAMSQSEHSLLHIFQIKWEIQCDLSAVWNNVCVIRRFDV